MQNLTPAQQAQIEDLQFELNNCTLPKKPQTAYQIFENKHFNLVKQQVQHLSSKEIQTRLKEKWNYGVADEEREQYHFMAKENKQCYYARYEEVQNKVSALREKIHHIKYCSNNSAVKPTGKLRFMTAYRFYRRDEVPRVKEAYPDLDGKDRHAMVRARWQKLPDKDKVAYVMMSRLDRERAIYMNKLSQIRENLLNEFPALDDHQQNSELLQKHQAQEDYEEYRRKLIAFK